MVANNEDRRVDDLFGGLDVGVPATGVDGRDQRVDHAGVELRASPTLEFVDGGGDRTSAAIGPGGGHRVERVGDRDDAGELRNLLGRQTVWIAKPVNALVVVANWRDEIAELAGALPDEGVDILLNPGGPASMRVLAAVVKEYVAQADESGAENAGAEVPAEPADPAAGAVNVVSEAPTATARRKADAAAAEAPAAVAATP